MSLFREGPGFHSEAPFHTESSTLAPAEAHQQVVTQAQVDSARLEAVIDEPRTDPVLNAFWAGLATSMVTFIIENTVDVGTKAQYAAMSVADKMTTFNIQRPDDLKEAVIAVGAGIVVGGIAAVGSRIARGRVLDNVAQLESRLQNPQPPSAGGRTRRQRAS